jgi:hypothetical protein
MPGGMADTAKKIANEMIHTQPPYHAKSRLIFPPLGPRSHPPGRPRRYLSDTEPSAWTASDDATTPAPSTPVGAGARAPRSELRSSDGAELLEGDASEGGDDQEEEELLGHPATVAVTRGAGASDGVSRRRRPRR